MTPIHGSSDEKPSFLAFGVRRPVAINLLMLAIIGAGLIFGTTLRREMFPEVTPSRAMITVIYPGASPEEVEEGMILKIEDKVLELADVDEVTSTINEGGGAVVVEFVDGVDDIDLAVNDVKAALDTLTDLPDEAERLRTTKFEATLPVITIGMFGEMTEVEKKRGIRNIQDDLESLPEMGEVQVYGIRTDEISVEITPATLLHYSLSLPDVAAIIQRYMKEIPGGTVRTSVDSVRVRTLGVDEQADAISDIIIKSNPSGSVIRLGDIATIEQSYEDVEFRNRVNGQSSASVTVVNVNDGDIVDMAETVRAYFAGLKGEQFKPYIADRINAFKDQGVQVKTTQDGSNTATSSNGATRSIRLKAYELGLYRGTTLPGDVVLYNDLAKFVEGRLELLTRNALYGAILVFLTLFVFLSLRVAGWVMIGLIVSLLGTLAFMAFMGITLNLLTMFGLIVVLGLLVDDAIVVAENIVARHESGEPPLSAAVNGVGQISWPIVATVLTTIAAFLPLRMVEGQMGDFLGALPIVVACALTVSLIESLMILPSHMGHSLERGERRTPGRIIGFFRSYEHVRDGWINRVVLPGFGRFVRLALRYRYITSAIALSVWLISVGLFAGGRVAFTFFPSTDSELFLADLQMPVGTAIDTTDKMVQRIEDVCMSHPAVRTTDALVGVRLDTNDWNVSGSQTNIGQVYVELVPVEDREQTSPEIISDIRAVLGDLTGVKSLRFEAVQGGPGGIPINIAILGQDIQKASDISQLIQDRLASFDGVFEISDDANEGQRELQISLLDGAAGLGLTPNAIALQIRGFFHGIEAHTFSMNREDVDIRVMLNEKTRRSLASLDDLYIFTNTGVRVPLCEVAMISEGTGYAAIHRLNRTRSLTVTADVDQAVTNPERVIAEITPYLAELDAMHPGITIEPRGRQLETEKSISSLMIGFAVACGIIYVILAWLFSSYLQPVAVMLGIPFAAVGMIWGHMLLGYDIMILSLIGFVALTGIVVNDSLILLEFYNHKRAEGLGVTEALVESSMRRLRPIVLTTVTTVLGLSPLMMEQSFQAKFLIPMAIAISGGLLSATGMILVVLPCLMLIGDDLRRVLHWCWTGGQTRNEPESDLF